MRTGNKKTSLLTYTALFTALTALATVFFRIPVGNGYIHLGDAIVILAAMILPRRYACFSAGVGSALADAAGGFMIWAPWTLAVKIIAVLILSASYSKPALFFSGNDPANDSVNKKHPGGKAGRTISTKVLAIIFAAIWSAAGYYVAELVIYGNPILPLAAVPFNLLQVAVGALISAFVYRSIATVILRS